jgi:hypothetical protein
MKKQGLLNKKIIIAYEFQSPAVTGRSKLRPYGMAFDFGTNSEIFTLFFLYLRILKYDGYIWIYVIMSF